LRRVIARGFWGCWSPDGRWLYYQDQEGPDRHLKKVPAAGGAPTVVRAERTFMPALSPDGRTLYFALDAPNAEGSFDYEIRRAQPEDGPSRLLARIPAHRVPDGRFHPVMSPDGAWLALPLADGVTTNLWAVSTADGAFRALTDFGTRPTLITRRLSWSSDGRFIYAAVDEGDADVVLLQRSAAAR
jgi:Tol biopolymer transport system component